MWFMVACLPKDSSTVVQEKIVQVSEKETENQLDIGGTELAEEVVGDEIPNQPSVVLDGIQIEVQWDDGDTFHGVHPNGDKIKARLNGFNTLESYGPVHQWGEWSATELYKIAKDSGVFASKTVWECTDTKRGGGYGRILVDCPELRKQMLEQGFAHPFSVKSPAPESDLEAMRKGMQNKLGIWHKGTPRYLITSLHSQDEKPDKDAYNRVCDLEIGQCETQDHTDTYTVCQNVCIEDTCMVYVPYKKRYGFERAECLR
jgi:endonuclease YncB( thermonuclease family)